jgi:large subunit ribosomal protein L15
MIKLEELHGDRGARQRRKRVGRGEGSGHGKTSGRGNKGAGSRSGFNKGTGLEGGQTPLHRRVPKRGFSNQPWATPVRIVNLSQLNRFDEGSTVRPETMAQAGMIPRHAPAVKVLGNGELTKTITVVAHAFSASAKAKIESAGGKWELVASNAASGKTEE